MLSRRALPALLLAGLVGGCTASSPLPAGRELLDAAKTSFSSVRSLHFSVAVTGVLPGLPLSKLDGEANLDRSGHAAGTAELADSTGKRGFSFTVEGSTASTKDSKGHVQTDRAAFTVQQFLGPDGGFVNLLTALRNPTTEIRETIQGVDGYRVSGTVPQAAAARLAPQIHADVNAKIWVTVAQPRRFARLWLQVPPETVRDSPVVFEVLLTQQVP
ncbi:LppX_LprAFG lipoprotein [Amycolatopsis jiangsuensis]|uniref:Lipoprotein LprG n=1 Tax=Amycolatopsis jiangsuensis TaxID=1181879 RepID=A0A840IWR0_9PSEU|nr:LppX_LprAFG lipoprotein [Amycolatopsis jiangsuensis]MBB4685949.1 lipoprotein LprG [Amycolatopsis jiangsuensis]